MLFTLEDKTAPVFGPFKLPLMKGQLAKDFYAMAEQEKHKHTTGVEEATQRVVASTGGTEA